jgi:hypothetical protein
LSPKAFRSPDTSIAELLMRPTIGGRPVTGVTRP